MRHPLRGSGTRTKPTVLRPAPRTKKIRPGGPLQPPAFLDLVKAEGLFREQIFGPKTKSPQNRSPRRPSRLTKSNKRGAVKAGCWGSKGPAYHGAKPRGRMFGEKGSFHILNSEDGSGQLALPGLKLMYSRTSFHEHKQVVSGRDG